MSSWTIIGIVVSAAIAMAVVWWFAAKDDAKRAKDNKEDTDEATGWHVGAYPPGDGWKAPEFNPKAFLLKYQNVEMWSAIVLIAVFTFMVTTTAMEQKHQLDMCVQQTGWTPTVEPGKVK